MKVTIVGGAGVVGSCTAFRIAQDGHASEIVLLDKRRNLAEAHALDIEQAVVHRSSAQVRVGEIEDTKGSDFIVMTVGFPHQVSVASRSEFLSQHLPPVMDLYETLAALSPSAVWFMATSPVDPLIYLIHRNFNIPRQKVLGLNRNDTSRFRWAIARTLSILPTAVEAFVIGEHGETQVPVFSGILIDGEHVTLSPHQEEKVKAEISGFYTNYKSLKSGRTAGWASAESIGDVFANIVTGKNDINVCSTPLEGEYGLSGVSLGVPVRLGSSGVQEVIEFDLNPLEKEALQASATRIKGQIQEGQRLFEECRVNRPTL